MNFLFHLKQNRTVTTHHTYYWFMSAVNKTIYWWLSFTTDEMAEWQRQLPVQCNQHLPNYKNWLLYIYWTVCRYSETYSEFKWSILGSNQFTEFPKYTKHSVLFNFSLVTGQSISGRNRSMMLYCSMSWWLYNSGIKNWKAPSSFYLVVQHLRMAPASKGALLRLHYYYYYYYYLCQYILFSQLKIQNWINVCKVWNI